MLQDRLVCLFFNARFSLRKRKKKRFMANLKKKIVIRISADGKDEFRLLSSSWEKTGIGKKAVVLTTLVQQQILFFFAVLNNLVLKRELKMGNIHESRSRKLTVVLLSLVIVVHAVIATPDRHREDQTNTR